MCDFVMDPIWCSPGPSGPAIAHECLEGTHPPGSASEEMSSRVLGFSVEEFANPVAALSDHEAKVLALVHTLVQVYTIPCTGQLAYVTTTEGLDLRASVDSVNSASANMT